MNEIIISTVVGTFVGYIIKRQLCPNHIEDLEIIAVEKYQECEAEKKHLVDENRVLKDPKRLINEYEGGEGSATGQQLASMRQRFESLQQNIEVLATQKKTLESDVKTLRSEVYDLKNALNSELQGEYDKGIDFLNKELAKARTAGATGINQSISKLEKKRAELENKDKDK